MTIADKLLQVNQVKQDIKTAIETKGIPMTNVAFTEYANKIADISGGDFYELWFEFFGATTKEEKMISLNKLTEMLLINGYTVEADEVNNYRDTNDLWPETIILGVLGEPAENTLLNRYAGSESYVINPQITTNGNFKEWHWDDSKWPFNEITDYTDSYGNKFKTIPKMYIKLVKDANGVINERYISNVKVDNDYQLPKSFIDAETGYELPYFYISSYEGSLNGDKYESKSGKTVKVDSTLNDFRNWANNNNEAGSYNYHIFDMHIKFVLETLYLIVFANTNSDELFPQGGSGSVQQTGVMDGMEHHTGYRTNLTNYPMKFLGIENYFSNTYTQVDGVKISGRAVYVCDNPRLYNSASNMDDYYLIGSTPTSNGWIKALGTTQGLFSIPITGGGVDNKWYNDNLYQGSSGPYTLYFGRDWYLDSSRGLFYWFGDFALDFSFSRSGARLVKKPLP